MALESVTLKKPRDGNDPVTRKVVTEVLERHEKALDALLVEGRAIVTDRRRMLDSIKDPALKLSAAR